MRALILTLAVAGFSSGAQTLPSVPLVIRDFTLQFDPAGTFSLSGAGWPTMNGAWKASGSEVTLLVEQGPKDCMAPGVYSFALDAQRVNFSLIKDDCTPRRMILDRSSWLPRGVTAAIAPRTITRISGDVKGPLPPVARGTGHWPSFRGREATGIADSPSPGGFGGAGKTEPSRSLEPRHQRKHPVEDADSRARAFQPDRVG